MNLSDDSNIDGIRVKRVSDASFSNEQLNHFHDLVYDQVLTAALRKVSKEYGNPPSPFSFFVMGSAGGWSNQFGVTRTTDWFLH